MDGSENGRRETRLLLMTIAVSAVMLLLLANFRFPGEAALHPADPAPAPLERLAARATFEELASIMADVERRITPTVVVVPVRGEDGEATHVPAVRVAADRAIALLGSGERVGGGRGADAPTVVARDGARNLVVLQVPSRPGDVVTPRTGILRPGPRYVAVVDATSQGIAVRPVYVGRTDVFQDPRIGDSMLSIGAVQQTLPRGAAIFTLDAAFMGIAVESAGLVTLQSAQTLMAAAEAAPPAAGITGDLGIDVQPLTPQLSLVAGTSTGVMVAYVDPGTPAAERVRPTDVIQAVAGLPVSGVGTYQQIVTSREPGSDLTLTLWRAGKTLTEAVRVREPRERGGADQSGGLALQTVRGTGAELLTAIPGSPAARAGLRAGDLIVAVADRRAPDAAEILKAYAGARSGETLLVTIRRGTEHRVMALEKP